MLRLLCLSLGLVVLSGCGSAPNRSEPTPLQVVAGGQTAGEVHWGGVIAEVNNLRDRTRIEVVALPLDTRGRPRPDAPSEGRFIVERGGFLEPHEYAQGRLLEVRGRLGGFSDGQVGAAAYRYPRVLADDLVLWPRDTVGDPRDTPRINFGLGVSNHGGGVGVGIGF